MRKNTRTAQHTNRKMDSNTYALRCKVMALVYEARDAIGGRMPRIDIRITDSKVAGLMGTARLNDNIIWIPASTIEESTDYLRHVVFHELAHTMWSVGHSEKCKLMNAYISSPVTKQQAHKILKYYSDKSV